MRFLILTLMGEEIPSLLELPETIRLKDQVFLLRLAVTLIRHLKDLTVPDCLNDGREVLLA